VYEREDIRRRESKRERTKKIHVWPLLGLGEGERERDREKERQKTERE